MSKVYTTKDELIQQEIVPALNGVEENFDLDAFVLALDEGGFIVHWASLQSEIGWSLEIPEETFWDLVQDYDQIAYDTLPIDPKVLEDL